MTESFLFLASVIAITALAEKIVARGYCYLKAVKNCQNEIRNLMTETNVLCGILGRLNVLLESNRSILKIIIQSRERASQNSNSNDKLTDDENVASSEDEAMSDLDIDTSYLSILSTMLQNTYAISSALSFRLHL